MSQALRILITLTILAGTLLGFWWWKHGSAWQRASRQDEQIRLRAWQELGSSERSTESAYQTGEEIGRLRDRRLGEISGITASRRQNGVWWVNNDSGDLPRVFAINANGNLLAIYRVVGAINEDWEDIGSGPGADGSPNLYLADVGDNGLKRDFVVVYRVKEPDISQGNESGETAGVEPLQFRYPDGRHNVEAMIVDPETGRIYLITKTDDKPCQVFRSPWPVKLGEQMTLEYATGSSLPAISQWRMVTSAAAAPDGSRVAIRTYFTAFELVRSPGKGFESIFDSIPVPIVLPAEQQGEAIAYSRDGTALLTTSEKLPAPIYQLKRKVTGK